jgi:hypothetical protein
MSNNIEHDPGGAGNSALAKVGARVEPLWRDWRIGTAVAVGVAGVWGLLAGWWTPRGPMTTGQVVVDRH